MVLLSPSLSFSKLHIPLLPKPVFLRKRQIQCELGERRAVCSCAASPELTSKQNGISKRGLVFFGISSSLSLVFPSPRSICEEDLKMVPLVDEINAYAYSYPVEMPSNKFLFKWVESRKPERYSSAAPLSPDARLRIVSERVDIVDNLIISVSIGPPNSQFIRSKDKSTWTAKDVADSVLSDKSALRVTSSQRLAESSVLDTHTGEPLSLTSPISSVRLMVSHTGIMNTLFANLLPKLLRRRTFIDTTLPQQPSGMVIYTR
ncbi:hypothetical protein HS088_TW23G00954 [Tripterygium wilfordii]|uniref:PsbP domain-containing protein 5 chloroplastic n=1 Tax=Tripterygium wilfordii TaxID=458696 RepID=A0A7J7BWF6_TRIWF|nr:hypothetical protein HS088_TW23G00954 [Tripterygium wilfordii]